MRQRDACRRRCALGQPDASLDGDWALDDIPGFGSTPESLLRDDAIAYWEAYRRGVAVRECMARHGFVWAVEAPYGDAVIDIAAFLGTALPGATPAAGSTVPEPAPEELNAAQVASLSGDERDAYYLALYGETAAAIEYLESSGGRGPPGRDAETFATGGCRGEADGLPRIWDIPRQLTDVVAAFQSADRASARAALSDSQRALLELQWLQYADAIERMRQDEELMDFVARESARIRAEMSG